MVENIFYLAVAAALGMFLGLERAIMHKQASLRTFSLVSLASCLFSILSVLMGTDPTRIAAQIVTGVGFLGSGIVFKASDKVEGVTTAAMIWVASALGMACGFHYVSLAIATLVIYTGILFFGKALHKLVDWFESQSKV